MNSQPAARVRTFLFTDLRHSTRLWDEHPDEMTFAVRDHFEQITRAVNQHQGNVFSHTGDGLVAVFDSPVSAIAAAAEAQTRLRSLHHPTLGRLASRMGVHTGLCYEFADQFSGRALNSCARLMSVGNADQVLVSGAAAELVARALPADVSLRRLGEFWLRDLKEAETVFQVEAPGLLSDFPPIRTRSTSIGVLPSETSPIVGRDEDVSGVTDLLIEGQRHLITLIGEPGVGKTRLALRLAHHLWDQFRDGVRWLDLSSFPTADAESAIASTLGIPLTSPDGIAWADIAESLGSTELLLIIDNCESDLMSAARLGGAIAVHAPSVSVLATSRLPLGTPDESLFAVQPLESGSANDMVPGPAVELFEARARRLRPSLDFDDAHRLLAHQITSGLDGLPLAIEHAAASLDVLSLTQIAEAISRDGLEQLRQFDKLSATIARSVDGLDPRESELFFRLPVIRGVITVGAAAAVFADAASPTATAALLTGLARRSLLHADEKTIEPSFSMFEATRSYALSQRELSPEVQVDHHRYFTELALAMGKRYRTADQVIASEALAGAWNDIRVVVARCAESGDTDTLARIVDELHHFASNSLRTDLYEWARRATRLGIDDPALACSIRGIEALGAWHRGDMSSAISAADDAIASDAPSEAKRLAYRAAMNAHGYVGRMDLAAPYYFGLVEACSSSDDAYWRLDGRVTESIGLSTVEQTKQATTIALDAVAAAEETRNNDCLFWAHFGLGTALAPSDPRSATAAFERAIRESESAGSHFNAQLASLELLVLRRRAGTFDISSAQSAWDLLGRFALARSTAQLWQLCLEVAWMLAQCGFFEPALELYTAVRTKPRMPRPHSNELDQQVHLAVTDVNTPADLPTHSFSSDADIIGMCRSGLATILGS